RSTAGRQARRQPDRGRRRCRCRGPGDPLGRVQPARAGPAGGRPLAAGRGPPARARYRRPRGLRGHRSRGDAHMKVVLFCGGLGTRLREHSDTIPKPLVYIGARPILWHLMRYYAHFGHKDFVLALGYRGDMVREYFLNYNEAMSNDFTLSEGGRKVELHSRDLDDWRITFVDTGLHSNIGQRLLRVRKYVENEPVFLANYSDGL